MIRIRSMTVGLPVGAHAPAEISAKTKSFLALAQQHLSREGLEPRTMRFTLPPFGAAAETAGVIPSVLRWVDDIAAETGVRWFCIPLDFTTQGPRRERLLAALDAMGKFPRAFLNMIVADKGAIAVEAINDAASFVLNLSKKTNNGFDNFRVGASANCPANAPFFPFSRHEGDELAFSFALETTGIALAVMDEPEIRHGRDIAVICDRMIAELTPALRRIDELGHALAQAGGVEYRGLDASLAPFPDGQMSVGALIEQILGAPVGSQGSVFITAMLTDVLRAALRESGARAVGFNGVMFSVLEDERLAAANSRRGITLESLTALAAVCGCGIDMVPVPGLSFQEEIAAVMLDIAALSSTLSKPLGIRLLPIPNKSVNEFTEFNLDFLCDSRVLALTSNDHRFKTAQHLLAFKAPLRAQ
jgi:uncharacterized protein (UPF0210 family)